MIVELKTEVWRNMTDVARNALLVKRYVRVRLFEYRTSKSGLKKVDRGFVE